MYLECFRKNSRDLDEVSEFLPVFLWLILWHLMSGFYLWGLRSRFREVCTVQGNRRYIAWLSALDSVDLDGGSASLTYTFDGTTRNLTPTVNDDWADQMAVNTILADFENGDRHFYGIDNGQSTILYFLTDDTAAKLRKLTDDPLERMVPPHGG